LVGISDAYSASTSGHSDFFLNDRWLLWDVANLLRSEDQRLQKLPQTREVKAFFRRHPELVEKPSYRSWKGPEAGPSDGDTLLLEDMPREYEQFEARGDERDGPIIIDSVKAVHSAIATESIEEVCDGIQKLREILSESARHCGATVEFSNRS